MNIGSEQPVSPVPGRSIQPVPTRQHKKGPVLWLLGALAVLVLLGVASLIAIRQTMGAYYIPSEAMEPTLMGHDAGTNPYTGVQHTDSVHDHVFVNKLIYQSNEPKFGDIIVFLAPKKADAEHQSGGIQVENILVKRVLGVPGDRIQIKESDHVKTSGGKFTSAYAVFRNGKQLDEPYIKEPMEPPQPTAQYGVNSDLVIASGQLFVMGDNRNDSNDSRYWGPLERSRVIGKVESIVAPAERQRSFP